MGRAPSGVGPTLPQPGHQHVASASGHGQQRVVAALASVAVVARPLLRQPIGLADGGIKINGEWCVAAVKLNWEAPADNADDITGYRVLRAKGTADLSALADDTGSPDTTYSDATAERGESYSYRVLALRGSVASAESDLVQVEVPSGPTAMEVEVTAVPIVVTSTTDDYFVLYVKHDVGDTEQEYPVLVKLGEAGTTTLAENVEALPAERYKVEKFLVANPSDVDGDCVDDISELNDLGAMNPVNPADAIDINDGSLTITDHLLFESFAQLWIPHSPQSVTHLKFMLADLDSARPRVYFMNNKTRAGHKRFAIDVLGVQPDTQEEWVKGQIAYSPNLILPNGRRGGYFFSTFRDRYSPSQIERTYTLLAASMPVLASNLVYWMPDTKLSTFQSILQSLRESRVPLAFNEDVFPSDISFLPLNPAVGYGRLQVLEPADRPHPHDIALYETLPNELPRVAGIISTVPQTPLSHVNLRAIQNGIPNAYIRGALDDSYVETLVGDYVYYLVTKDGWELRAATLAEVETHYAASRPAQTQSPQRDLTVTTITALDDIDFEDWNAFGVKAANLSVLRTLGFPEGTVPDGFAIPFYFYDEFMKANDLYDDVTEMLANEEFQTDFEVQDDMLDDLRDDIKDAETPQWIIDALAVMHATYPEGQSLRYRSSTNNEDLPGFNGAGLYDSKTQKAKETEEDGIDKSLKQVFASLWTFRAFTEREFHRIDHMAAAMGVLVHPNFKDELANGVAVTFDPYSDEYDSYYVNTQIGEDLVTNPEAHSVPEEILLNRAVGNGYRILATSNQVEPPGQLLMSDDQYEQLKGHLTTIHDHFEPLYDPATGEPFAMEIEFKITSDNVLAIKQARPWVFPAPVMPSNNVATGRPTISGTAQVDETLTADTSGIADSDGLDDATFSYQWLTKVGDVEADIAGATGASYTLVATDEGKTIRVRVSFTDDASNEETLTSEATAAVEPMPVSEEGAAIWSATMTVGPDNYGYGYSAFSGVGELSPHLLRA